ncbi:MAG: L,D-transpeptidase family protein [Nanobdellota archaeon]
MLDENDLESKLDDFHKKKGGHVSVIEKIWRKFRITYAAYAVGIGILAGYGMYSLQKMKSETEEKIEERISDVSTPEREKTTTQNEDKEIEENPEHEKKSIFEKIDDKDMIIYVNKTDNETKLYDTDKDEFIYEANSIDGEGGQGPKERKGDHKTPEGFYDIVRAKKLDKEHELYGEGFIKIDYPNNSDLREGRNGGGMLLCGTGRYRRKRAIEDSDDITNGGVIMKNYDIKNIINKVRGEDAVVMIEDRKRKLDMNDYNSY